MSDTDSSGTGLRTRIEEAKRLVAMAEAELDEALRAFRPLQIGDKGLISARLDLSFDKLKAARAVVAQLSGLLAAIERTEA